MLPFFPQERPESCVPACLRMVLANAGVVLSEAEVYVGCETDVDGTLPSKAALFAATIGFTAIALRLTELDELHSAMHAGSPYPIVFVNLSSLLGINVIHAVVVESIDAEHVTIVVVDPAFPPMGRRTWPLRLFEIGWRVARCQTILVSTE